MINTYEIVILQLKRNEIIPRIANGVYSYQMNGAFREFTKY